MNRWMKFALVCALSGALIGCDEEDPMGTDSGTPGGDAGPGSDDAGPGPGEDAGPPTGCPAVADRTEVSVDGEITEDTTWTCDNLYVLDGRVWVTNDSTLTIEAGTLVLGETGVPGGSALGVTRGSQLNAVGTADAPIVFTSGNAEGSRVTGDWAGVFLLGSATTNDGSCEMDDDPATPECDAPGFLEDRIEGIEVADDRGRYGGNEDTSSCGTLRYVRIEFAGAELSPDNELNGLTIGGCGSGTELSYIQVHRGKDDGIEFFGGTANLDHAIISGPSDDGLDCDEGWRGTGQFIVVHQFPGIGDNAIECDSLGSDEDAMPRTNPNLSNLTLVGAGEGRVAVLREGFNATITNTVAFNFDAPPDLRAAEVDLSSEWPGQLSWENSYFHMTGDWPTETGEDDDDGGFDEQAAFEDAARMNDFSTDPMIMSIEITSPNYMPGAALSAPAPTFGDTGAAYAGAFEMGGDNWADGWTAFPAN